MPATMTQHARARLQQRGIPQTVLDSLLDYGREEHDQGQCRALF
jgi:hypothetical protein